MRSMNRPGGIVLLLLLGGLPALSGRAGPEPAIFVRPPPDWVEPLPLDTDPAPPDGGVVGGLYYLLLESQIDAVATPKQRFSHYAVLITNEIGVRDASQIGVDFDPSYEELHFHFIRVHRGAETIEKLDPQKIEILQRESELGEQVYEGSRTALQVLHDVRRGDVLEVAFSIVGENPVLQGHYDVMFAMQWTTSVGRVHRRLLWPEGRPLRVRSFGSAPDPRVSSNAGVTEYIWEAEGLPPYEEDRDVPPWFMSASWIQASEFESWGQVATWGSSLYRTPERIPDSVDREVRRIRNELPDPERRILAATRFVQDEVRYLSVTLGEGAMQPSLPGDVLARRFGDCKDKSLLLVTILKGLGVRSAPALVSSSSHSGIRDWLPSPQDFDHCIVRVEAPQGEVWVDPTRQYQRGSLSDLYRPDYQVALVLEPGETDLRNVPELAVPHPLREITKTFWVGEEGDSVRFTVSSTCRGPRAEELRGQLAILGRDRLADLYLAFYRQEFPTVRMNDPLEIDDDEVENVVQVEESYVIPEFWSLSPDSSKYEVGILPVELSGMLTSPGEVGRGTPLALVHPQHTILRSILHLPEGFEISDAFTDIENASFRYESVWRYGDGELHVRDELETFADAVPAGLMEHYRADYNAVDNEMGIYLSKGIGKAGPDRVNWILGGVTLGVLSLSILGALALFRLRPALPPERQLEIDDRRAGLGGWLILIGIGVTLTPLTMVKQLAEFLVALDGGTWAALTGPGNRYPSGIAGLCILECSALTVLLVASILSLIMFYTKHRLFPAVFVGTGVLSLAAGLLDAELADAISSTAPVDNAGRGFLVAALVPLLLWGTYLFRSRRAKSTFVR